MPHRLILNSILPYEYVETLGTHIDGGYSIPLDLWTDKHRMRLTCAAKMVASSIAPQKIIKAYDEDDSRVDLPRFYGMTSFGVPEVNGMCPGAAMSSCSARGASPSPKPTQLPIMDHIEKELWAS